MLHAVACAVLLIGAASLAAQAPAPLAALARMPVKEVTVFKDGHAFVLHEGAMPTDAAGNVLHGLPAVARARHVLAVLVEHRREAHRRRRRAAPGARRADGAHPRRAARRERRRGGHHHGENLSGAGSRFDTRPRSSAFLERSSDELATTGLPNAAPRTPEKGSVILVRTSDGVKALSLESIQDVTFKTPPKGKLSHEEFRNLLTLKLDWANRKPSPTAQVGLVYLQKGLRWIPGYRVTLDGNGTAAIKLQATLVNELTDLDGCDRQPGDRRAELRLQGHDGSDRVATGRRRSCRRTSSRATACR